MFEPTNQHEEETVVFSRNLASRLEIIDSFASYLGLSKDEAFSTQDTMGKCGSRVIFREGKLDGIKSESNEE
jgi:hypothetical protein